MEKTTLVKDFYSGCVLRCFDIPISKLVKSEDRFVIFVFNADPQICERILSDFWNRKLSVEPRKFIENINELKTRIHEILKK